MYEKTSYMGFDLNKILEYQTYTNICDEISLPNNDLDKLAKQLINLRESGKLEPKIFTIPRRHLLIKRFT